MGVIHHPFPKLLLLFLGISCVFFYLTAAVPATRIVKGDVAIVETEPFSESDSEDVEGEGEGWFVEGRMELEREKEKDYTEPGPNPRHYPPPNPSRS